MTTYAIIETDITGNIPADERERCYLNHAYLSSMAFGSLDMAWTTDNRLAAEGMAARLAGDKYRHHEIIDLW